jgi:hypothetical protein
MYLEKDKEKNGIRSKSNVFTQLLRTAHSNFIER